jgi:hypothetical protein
MSNDVLRTANDKWAERQVRAMVGCGVSLANAQAAVAFALKRLPQNADPQTYILPAELLEQNVADPALVQDARTDFYASEHIALQYKRILDARSVNATR